MIAYRLGGRDGVRCIIERRWIYLFGRLDEVMLCIFAIFSPIPEGGIDTLT